MACTPSALPYIFVSQNLLSRTAPPLDAKLSLDPLYENAFRAHRGQTLQGNNDESAALYAAFAEVAARNEYSWNYGKPPAKEEEIGTVSRRNRLICSPCKSRTAPHLFGTCQGID